MACKKGIIWKKIKNRKAYCQGESDGDEYVCIHVQVHRNSGRNWRTLSEVICHLRIKKLAIFWYLLLFPVILLEAFILQGKAREHTSPVLKWWRRTKAYSLLYFTLSALHTAEAQLMLVELNVLNCTGGKRGLRGFGGSKSILQEGQFQVETEILNLWICLLWTGDIYLEWETKDKSTYWNCWHLVSSMR